MSLKTPTFFTPTVAHCWCHCYLNSICIFTRKKNTHTEWSIIFIYLARETEIGWEEIFNNSLILSIYRLWPTLSIGIPILICLIIRNWCVQCTRHMFKFEFGNKPQIESNIHSSIWMTLNYPFNFLPFFIAINIFLFASFLFQSQISYD